MVNDIIRPICLKSNFDNHSTLINRLLIIIERVNGEFSQRTLVGKASTKIGNCIKKDPSVVSTSSRMTRRERRSQLPACHSERMRRISQISGALWDPLVAFTPSRMTRDSVDSNYPPVILSRCEESPGLTILYEILRSYSLPRG